MTAAINPFAQSIIETTLCIDDLVKMANEYGGTLIDSPWEMRMRVGDELVIYEMNQYLWKRYRIVRYTFTETRFA